jgi:hypothetical protein
LTNYIKIDLFIQNPLPDLRQQYINNNHDSLRRCQSTLSNEERPSTQNTSMTSMSDFELNYINMTRTSLFSPSVYESLHLSHDQFKHNLAQSMSPIWLIFSQ